MKKLVLFCSTAFVLPTAAFAQSTSSQEFEKEAEKVVVTATRQQQVGGVVTPDSTKAKAVLTQEYIARQAPGQTVLDTINAVPGVSFQNNDAYGSSGGTLTIRGFDSSRISLTFDGIQLNDSGNYAIYSNQQIDPELIEQVNVNLGTTDVDSPTASAVGGTVNLRMRNPATKFGGRVVGSLGEDDFRRIFASIDTGEIGPWGTRALVAVSTAKNDNPFNNYGKVDKQQYNAKIYQPIGSNGDFVSIAGHYNQNRNNFFGSLPLRTDKTKVVNLGTSAAPIWTTVPRIVGPNSGNRYPDSRDDRFYDINYPCTVDTPSNAAGSAGADTPSSSTGRDAPGADPNDDYAVCGTEFDRRYNPSNTGNIRIQSRWTLTDRLTLTVDPSYQYVKANGGGTVSAREYGFDISPTGTGTGGRANCSTTASNGTTVVCVPGYFGGNPYFGGVDLNGDGDVRDQVNILAPSQTQTDRLGVIAGLRYVINDNHQVRLTYTLDNAHHRQTGETQLLGLDGEPFDVFPVNDPLHFTFNGASETIQKRDRRSKAILNQISAEYRGEFIDDRLTVNVGLRAPFFKRDLTNYCFTSSASGFVECSGQNADLNAIAAANNPYVVDPATGRVISGWAPPGHRVLKYDDILPNVGFIFDVTSRVSVFANYAKGLSVPSTDNLYNAFYFPEGSDAAKPDPETTNSIDLGVRYRSSTLQAQLSGWSTKFKNRSASAYDPELNQTVYRNLGTVDKWGIDASVAWAPLKQLTLYAFGSWMDSEIKDNIQIGSFGTGVNQITDCDNLPAGANPVDVVRSCSFTAGNRESGAPKYTYGFSASTSIGPVDFGFVAKRTGPRYIFDDNRAVYAGDIGVTSPTTGRLQQFEVFGSTAPAYWLVNLDARLNMHFVGLKETYFQLNVYNLFDKLYVGGFGGGLSQALSSRTCNTTSYPACGSTTTVQTWGNPPFVQIGAPRTVSGTLSISF